MMCNDEIQFFGGTGCDMKDEDTERVQFHGDLITLLLSSII